MHLTIGAGEVLLSPQQTYNLFLDACDHEIIENIIPEYEWDSDEPNNSKRSFVVGNVKFKFKLNIHNGFEMSRPETASTLEIFIITDNEVQIFHTYSGWLFTVDELPHRNTIINFLTKIYNKVEKINKVKKDAELSRIGQEKATTLEKLNSIKIVGLY